MRLLLPALAALALAACDFTPTLDVPLPEHTPALTINGVLAADSTVEVRVTESADPYGTYSQDGVFAVPEDAVVDLYRDGVRLGALALRSEACVNYSESIPPPPADPPTYECGSFVSDVVVEPGATYTVRASAPGFPDAEATVTVPGRVAVSVEASEPRTHGPRTDRDLTVTFRDPPGPGDRYALMVVSGPYSYEGYYCDNRVCRDSTVTVYRDRDPLGYTTTDPVLLAGARTVPSTGTDFITFTDEEFDGTERAFVVRSQTFNYSDGTGLEPAAVWVAAIDDRTFGAYQVVWFGGGEDNPFAEPADPPSNVVGGYGLLGAVTINEARLPDAP